MRKPTSPIILRMDNFYMGDPISVFPVLLPADAHRPNVHVDGYDVVKKVVVKIKVVD